MAHRPGEQILRFVHGWAGRQLKIGHHLPQQLFAPRQIKGGGEGLLRPFLAGAVGEQRQVGIVRLRVVQAALQPDLARRRNQQVLAADDMGDALLGIVGHYRKLVGPEAVGAQKYEVADVAGEILAVAADNGVVENNIAIGHAQAPGRGFAVFRLPESRIGAAAAINKTVGTGARFLLPLAAAAVAGIDQAARLQIGQHRAVQRMAAALVGDFAVPFKTEGFQRAQNVGGGAGHLARRVKVFHAQQPTAAGGTGGSIGRGGGQQRADVQQAGGAGGETAGVGIHGGKAAKKDAFYSAAAAQAA